MVLKTKSLSILKNKEKIKSKNHRKAVRTRRQRGYHWEDTIVKRFNSVNDWNAFRLGSPSTALPDVLAVNNTKSTIFTIEAKSLKWINIFEIYKIRKVILAFKFLSKKRTGLGTYESRELREFYKVWDPSIPIAKCSCSYDGQIFTQIDGKRQEIHLEDLPMPFKTKFRNSA
jgi:hypothetical protein